MVELSDGLPLGVPYMGIYYYQTGTMVTLWKHLENVSDVVPFPRSGPQGFSRCVWFCSKHRHVGAGASSSSP